MDVSYLAPQAPCDKFIISVSWQQLDATMPHLWHKVSVHWDGADVVTYTREVNQLLPAVWVDGLMYKFNSTLVSVQRERPGRK
jgi:hypothetical protein